MKLNTFAQYKIRIINYNYSNILLLENWLFGLELNKEIFEPIPSGK